MRSTANRSPASSTIIFSGVRAYRKKVLVGKLAAFLEQEICRICEANTWIIGALNVEADHVHLFLNASPSIALVQIAYALKGITGHLVFQYFPPRQEKTLGRRPSRSRLYYVGSVGDMS
jgi:putative transposase